MDKSPSSPLQCIFMAPLTFFNEGVRAQFPLHITMVWDLAIGIGDSGSEERH